MISDSQASNPLELPKCCEVMKCFCYVNEATFGKHLSLGASCQWSQPCNSLGTEMRLTLCDPVDCSMTGLPVHHQLSQFTQTHAH